MTNPRDPVREVMSRGAISVDEKLTLRSLAAVLSELDIGAVLVEQADGSAAIVSERDIVSALGQGADPDDVWASDITANALVIAEPQETVLDIAQRMADEGVRHIAVVDHGRIVGVVSARDLMAVLSASTR
jgi:CBS domain-containing protein